MPSPSRLHVVETDSGTAHLGVPVVAGDYLQVMTGLRGRPVVLHRDEVESITAAEGHPDVEWAPDSS